MWFEVKWSDLILWNLRRTGARNSTQIKWHWQKFNFCSPFLYTCSPFQGMWAAQRGNLFSPQGMCFIPGCIPNFQLFRAILPEINWFGTWKVGSFQEPKESWLFQCTREGGVRDGWCSRVFLVVSFYIWDRAVIASMCFNRPVVSSDDMLLFTRVLWKHRLLLSEVVRFKDP